MAAGQRLVGALTAEEAAAELQRAASDREAKVVDGFSGPRWLVDELLAVEAKHQAKSATVCEALTAYYSDPANLPDGVEPADLSPAAQEELGYGGEGDGS